MNKPRKMLHDLLDNNHETVKEFAERINKPATTVFNALDPQKVHSMNFDDFLFYADALGYNVEIKFTKRSEFTYTLEV